MKKKILRTSYLIAVSLTIGTVLPGINNGWGMFLPIYILSLTIGWVVVAIIPEKFIALYLIGLLLVFIFSLQISPMIYKYRVTILMGNLAGASISAIWLTKANRKSND